MEALIFGNGNFENNNMVYEILKSRETFVIGVDGGCNHLIDNKIKIDLAIGDFDSIKYKDVVYNTSNTLKTNMNISDLEFAIDYCLDKNFSKAYLFGFTGKRCDHFLLNLNCMVKGFKNNLEILMIDEFNIITLIEGEKIFDKGRFRFFSIIPIYDNTRISISGSKYDLYDEKVDLFSTLTLSNEWKEEKVKIHVDKLVYVCLVL